MSFKKSFTSFFLNKSNTYNYYKNNLKKSNEERNKIKKVLNKTYSKMDKINEKLKISRNELNNLKNTHINMENTYKNKIIELEEKLHEKGNFDIIQSKIFLNTKELVYSNVFKDTIKNSNWLKNKNFSLINGAANYSFMYLVYRILNDLEPKNILELGLGQTTKITTQYTFNDSNTSLLVIENNQAWIDNFSKNLVSCENILIKCVPEEVWQHTSTENIRYANLKTHIGDEKFDFIIVDGPLGMNQEYPRTNIWDIVHENLKEEFIIIIDDYERLGEKNMVKELLKISDTKNIDYNTVTYSGVKEQFIICTEKFKPVLWF